VQPLAGLESGQKNDGANLGGADFVTDNPLSDQGRAGATTAWPTG